MGPKTARRAASLAVTSFNFRGRTLRVDPVERERFRTSVRSAFRVAHGLGVGFRMLWESGPNPRVAVVPEGHRSVGWMRGLLAPAFEPGQWVEHRQPLAPNSGAALRVAVPVRGNDAPFPSESESMPWADSAVLGLSQIGPGIQVIWEVRPSFPNRARTESDPRNSLVAVPPGFRPSTPTGPERAIKDAFALRAQALTWGVRCELRSLEQGIDPAQVDRATLVVSRVGRRDGGNELRFRRPLHFLGLGAPWFLLSEEEIVGLVPSPWAQVGWTETVHATGRFPLWIGPEGRPGAVPVQLDRADGRHMAILGETGMGKSSLVVRLALQAARHGSVVMFDPIGDTAERFIAGLPARDTDRSTFVSPERSPLGLNALGMVQRGVEDSRGRNERLIGDLVNGLRRVRAQRFADTPFWGPRIEEVVTIALRLAAAFPEGTLEVAFELLEGAERLGRAVPEAARSAAAELRRRVAERPEEVDGARRLLSEVVRNPILRQMLCEPKPRWNLEESIRPGRITVFSGDAPQVGELVARYLLAVDLALLWSALVRRTQPSKVFVFLDEAQWFAHESAAEMLRMGRRFNVHLIFATQSLSSLPESLRESVLTNVAEFVLFRGAPAEAREFARWVPGLPVERVQTLARGEAAVLVEKGRVVRWVRIEPTRSGLAPNDRLAEIVRQSNQRFGAREENPPEMDEEAGVSLGTARPGTRRLILLTLATGASGCSPVPWFRVYLRPLREVCDRSGQVIRELGTELQRTGALARAGRDSRGGYWELSTDGWPARAGAPATDAERDEAATRWAKVAGGE